MVRLQRTKFAKVIGIAVVAVALASAVIYGTSLVFSDMTIRSLTEATRNDDYSTARELIPESLLRNEGVSTFLNSFGHFPQQPSWHRADWNHVWLSWLSAFMRLPIGIRQYDFIFGTYSPEADNPTYYSIRITVWEGLIIGWESDGGMAI